MYGLQNKGVLRCQRQVCVPHWLRLWQPARITQHSIRTEAHSAALASGLIHIDETVILAGSTTLAVVVPGVFSGIRRNKIKEIAAEDAVTLIQNQGARLVDIRTHDIVSREGAPSIGHISAPWLKVHGSTLVKRNRGFEDAILFSAGVSKSSAFIILDQRNGKSVKKAAKAIAESGGHEVFIMKGGFKAWKAAGLPCTNGQTSVEPQTAAEKGSSAAAAAAAPAAADASLAVHADPTAVTKFPFQPKMLEVLAQGYSLSDLRQDVLSGLVVGVIAMSLSMALGIASESTPAVGLYTAVVAGFITSALGGSRVDIGGPTAAFIPIVVGVAHKYGPEDLVVCTGMAGLMLMAMGATGLGTTVKYIPKPVVTGFTAGIASYILGTQIKDFMGLGVPGHLPPGVGVPAEFLEKVVYLGSHLDATHLPSLGLALSCLVLMKAWPASWAKVLPPQIAAVVLGTAGVFILDWMLDLHTGIETIGSHFGAEAIPRSLPSPHMPNISPSHLQDLLYPAFTISLLGAIESLLCARVADKFIDDKHDSNTELIAVGMANCASAAFGGLPATGALARTAANVRAGGRSPIAGVVHSLTVLAIILVASPLAAYIPLPALSAVLVIVGLNMGEWKNFKELVNWRSSDQLLYLLSFSLTLLQDVAVAIEFGMAAALLMFVKDVSTSVHIEVVDSHKAAAAAGGAAGAAGAAPAAAELAAAGIACVKVSGSLLFGGGEELEEALDKLRTHAPVSTIIVDLSNVTVMDISGFEVLEDECKRLHKAGKRLVLCGLSHQPLAMLSRTGFLAEVGEHNVFRNLSSACEALLALEQQQAGADGYVDDDGETFTQSTMPATSLQGTAAIKPVANNIIDGSAAAQKHGWGLHGRKTSNRS